MMGYSYTGWHDAFWNRAVWEYTFVLWPQRCEVTNRILFLEYAYKGTAVWTGPGTPAYEYKWLSKNEYLVAAIKGLI